MEIDNQSTPHPLDEEVVLSQDTINKYFNMLKRECDGDVYTSIQSGLIEGYWMYQNREN